MKELNVQLKKLDVEQKEAATAIEKAEAERKIAELEKQKADVENAKALAAEKFKAEMIVAELATAQAQEAYRQAMEQIEASKILLTDEEQARLNIVEAKVAYAKIAMDMAMFGYSTTEVNCTNFGDGKVVYDISQHPENAQGGYQHGSLKYLQEQLADYPNWVADGNIEAKLKLAVERAEASLNKAQKKADGYKAILDNEYTTLADWEAEVKKLKDEMAALDVQKRQYELEKEKLKVANPKLGTDKDDAKAKHEKAVKDHKDVAKTTKVASAYSKKADESILEGLRKAVGDGVDGYDPSTGKFSYSKDVLVTDAQKKIDGWNKLIDAATKGIDMENLEWSELEVKKAKDRSTKAAATYEADLQAWRIAFEDYAEVEGIDVEGSKVKAYNEIKEYNKLGDDARKQDTNIQKVVDALVKYYGDATKRNAQNTAEEIQVENVKRAISVWISGTDALTNFKLIVGVKLGIFECSSTIVTKANIISDGNVNKLLTLGSPASDAPYAKWETASLKVFGDKLNFEAKPRRTEVSFDELMKAVDNDELSPVLEMGRYGSYGISIYAKAEADRLQAVLDQEKTYNALKDEFTAQSAKEQATLDKKKAELAEKVTKAKTALDEANAAYDKVFKEVEDNIKKVDGDYTSKDQIKNAIESTISDYIASLDEFGEGYKEMTLEEIKEVINDYYLNVVRSLQYEQANLAKAKRNVEKFAEGTYTDNFFIEDTLANIQEKIKVQQAEYDAAKADYDAASEQLKALLAIFLK